MKLRLGVFRKEKCLGTWKKHVFGTKKVMKNKVFKSIPPYYVHTSVLISSLPLATEEQV